MQVTGPPFFCLTSRFFKKKGKQNKELQLLNGNPTGSIYLTDFQPLIYELLVEMNNMNDGLVIFL
jgi:hypothetical protein